MENSSMKWMSPSRYCAWTVLTASSPVYPLTLVSISLSCISLVSFNIFYYLCSDNLQRKSLWRCSWSPGFEPFPTKLTNNSIEMFSDFFFFFFFEDILNIYFCLHWVIVAVHGLFPGCGKQGLLFLVVHGLLIEVTSLVAEDKL